MSPHLIMKLQTMRAIRLELCRKMKVKPMPLNISCGEGFELCGIDMHRASNFMQMWISGTFLNKLESKEEIKAVVAHELAHLHFNHMDLPCHSVLAMQSMSARTVREMQMRCQLEADKYALNFCKSEALLNVLGKCKRMFKSSKEYEVRIKALKNKRRV